jgi:ABC-2 type transport system permease protein
MRILADMIWIELRKALRSRMPLWTALASLFMPCGVALLIYLARNPEIGHKLGLLGAKADLMKYSTTDWSSYLALFGLVIAAGGFFFYVLAISWVFGREFTDGTLKDVLAVPVPRASILLAKFILAAAWCALMSACILVAGLVLGAATGLPGGSSSVILHGSLFLAITACLTIVSVLPFALFASLGRGFLLPLGAAVLILMMTNLLAIAGWGEYFPWAVAGLYAQNLGGLPAVSYWIVVLAGLAGMAATYFWWKYADQNR